MKEKHEQKLGSLDEREKMVYAGETKVKQQQREVIEREQRLQVAMSNVAKSETDNATRNENLMIKDAEVKRREHVSLRLRLIRLFLYTGTGAVCIV